MALRMARSMWSHAALVIGAGIVTGLVVLALVGVVFVFVGYFIRARATSAGAGSG
jgi:hypothetical protein